MSRRAGRKILDPFEICVISETLKNSIELYVNKFLIDVKKCKILNKLVAEFLVLLEIEIQMRVAITTPVSEQK